MSITSQDETTRSQPHRRVEKILSKMHLMYESEYGFPPYSVDIYLSEFHIGLEIDGPSHSVKKDGVRDMALLRNYWLPVMHLPIELSAEDIQMSVVNFIELAGPSAEERKRLWRESGS